MRPRHRLIQMLWFVAVGCSAAFVHWITAVLFVELGGLKPLWANVVGWLMALSVSFAGHYGLTFRGHGTPVRKAAARFFAVSALGFGVNSLTYAAFLRWDPVHYDGWLGLTLVLVAGMTYLLSRHWAFLRTPAAP